MVVPRDVPKVAEMVALLAGYLVAQWEVRGAGRMVAS